MRNISFSITIEQFKNRTKTVTRRLGWKDIKPGDRLLGIEKGQGLKKGEKVVALGVILVKRADRERLDSILDDGEAECAAEGFPELTPAQFVRMFCVANQCKPDQEITRIEFEYVDVAGAVYISRTIINPAAPWPFPKTNP